MEFGVQLFGLSKKYREAPEALLRALSGMGYRQIEPCIAFGPLGGFEAVIWTEDTLAAAWPLLDKYGLSVPSCHVFSGDFRAMAPRLQDIAANYGIRRFVVNCPREIELAAYRSFAADCVALAEALAQVGAELLLHNNYGEIRQTLEGRTAYEWLLDACGGQVYAQPDVGWLLYGGEDPEAFLWRNAHRIRALHYKDIKAGDVPPDSCGVCLGEGRLDVLACFQFARFHGIPQIVDQDMSDGDILSDLETSHKLLSSFGQRRDNTRSCLNLLDVETGEVRLLHKFDSVVEAPNVLRDGDTVIYNAEGRLWRYSISGGSAVQLESGDCDNCNNDHVPSPDNRQIALSHSGRQGFQCRIYTIPVEGGTPTLVTPNSPSFLHGWSPDGGELAYCRFRRSRADMQVDIYAISPAGGEETRLTHREGFNDGPEYAPNGKHIWFNSTRSGLMQVWRMDRDGGNPVQMTDTPRNNWFPHVSPDGTKVVYLAYQKGALEPHEHLPNMQVELWMMNYDGSGDRRLLSFSGGKTPSM